MKIDKTLIFIGIVFIYFGIRICTSDKGYYFRDAYVSSGSGYIILFAGIFFLILSFRK